MSSHSSLPIVSVTSEEEEINHTWVNKLRYGVFPLLHFLANLLSTIFISQSNDAHQHFVGMELQTLYIASLLLPFLANWITSFHWWYHIKDTDPRIWDWYETNWKYFLVITILYWNRYPFCLLWSSNEFSLLLKQSILSNWPCTFSNIIIIITHIIFITHIILFSSDYSASLESTFFIIVSFLFNLLYLLHEATSFFASDALPDILSIPSRNNSSVSKLAIILEEMRQEEQTISPDDLNRALVNNGRDPEDFLQVVNVIRQAISPSALPQKRTNHTSSTHLTSRYNYSPSITVQPHSFVKVHHPVPEHDPSFETRSATESKINLLKQKTPTHVEKTRKFFGKAAARGSTISAINDHPSDVTSSAIAFNDSPMTIMPMKHHGSVHNEHVHESSFSGHVNHQAGFDSLENVPKIVSPQAREKNADTPFSYTDSSVGSPAIQPVAGAETPNDADMRDHFMKGLRHEYEGSYSRSQEHFKIALAMVNEDLDPEFAAVIHFNWGNQCWFEHNYKDAEAHYLQSVKLHESIPAFCNLGVLYVNQSPPSYEKGHEYFLKALKISMDQRVLNNIAILMETEQQFDLAKKAYNYSLAAQPEDKAIKGETYYFMGLLYKDHLKDPEMALKILKKAASSGYFWANYYLSSLCVGDPNQEIKYSERFLREYVNFARDPSSLKIGLMKKYWHKRSVRTFRVEERTIQGENSGVVRFADSTREAFANHDRSPDPSESNTLASNNIVDLESDGESNMQNKQEKVLHWWAFLDILKSCDLHIPEVVSSLIHRFLFYTLRDIEDELVDVIEIYDQLVFQEERDKYKKRVEMLWHHRRKKASVMNDTASESLPVEDHYAVPRMTSGDNTSTMTSESEYDHGYCLVCRKEIWCLKQKCVDCSIRNHQVFYYLMPGRSATSSKISIASKASNHL